VICGIFLVMLRDKNYGEGRQWRPALTAVRRSSSVESSKASFAFASRNAKQRVTSYKPRQACPKVRPRRSLNKFTWASALAAKVPVPSTFIRLIGSGRLSRSRAGAASSSCSAVHAPSNLKPETSYSARPWDGGAFRMDCFSRPFNCSGTSVPLSHRLILPNHRRSSSSSLASALPLSPSRKSQMQFAGSAGRRG
jgi:hypothetical protein